MIARVNALWRGRSQPATHEGDSRPSVQRSSLRISISVMAALTDLVSCCAPAALFTAGGKGRVAMRATSFRSRVTYAANGDFMPHISSSVGGSDRGGTGDGPSQKHSLGWSPARERLLSRSAEDTTSTKEGVACLFPVTTATSPRSELEAEDELKGGARTVSSRTTSRGRRRAASSSGGTPPAPPVGLAI